MRKQKFNNGVLVLREISEVAKKHGFAVTKWAAMKWIKTTNEKQKLNKQLKEVKERISKLK